MNLSAYITKMIMQICPIEGLSMGASDDKSTWRFSFASDATSEQKQAAQDYIDNLVLDASLMETIRKIDRDQKFSSDLLYNKNYKDYLLTNPGVTFSEFMDYLETLL